MRTLALIIFLFAGLNAQMMSHQSGSGGGGGGTPPASYTFEEGFEGTGYENSWTESGTGTIDEDYTTSPAPLAGSQSLYINTIAEYAQTTDFTGLDSEVHCYFVYNITTRSASNTTIFAGTMSNSATCFTFSIRATGSGTVYRGYHGTVVSSFDAAVGYSDATTYHCWLDWTAESEADAGDGTLNIYIATSSTKPGSPDCQITTGDQEGAFAQARFYGGNSGQIFDHFIMDDSTIGSAP